MYGYFMNKNDPKGSKCYSNSSQFQKKCQMRLAYDNESEKNIIPITNNTKNTAIILTMRSNLLLFNIFFTRGEKYVTHTPKKLMKNKKRPKKISVTNIIPPSPEPPRIFIPTTPLYIKNIERIREVANPMSQRLFITIIINSLPSYSSLILFRSSSIFAESLAFISFFSIFSRILDASYKKSTAFLFIALCASIYATPSSVATLPFFSLSQGFCMIFNKNFFNSSNFFSRMYFFSCSAWVFSIYIIN